MVEKASIDEAFVLLQGQTGTEAAAAASAAAELGEGDGDDADGEEPGWAAQAALHRAQEVKAAGAWRRLPERRNLLLCRPHVAPPPLWVTACSACMGLLATRVAALSSVAVPHASTQSFVSSG